MTSTEQYRSFIDSILELAEQDELPEAYSDVYRNVFGLARYGLRSVRNCLRSVDEYETYLGYASARVAFEHAVFAQEYALGEEGRKRLEELWSRSDALLDFNVEDSALRFQGRTSNKKPPASPKVAMSDRLNKEQLAIPRIYTENGEYYHYAQKHLLSMADYGTLSRAIHTSRSTIDRLGREMDAELEAEDRAYLFPILAKIVALLRGSYLFLDDNSERFFAFRDEVWESMRIPVQLFDSDAPRFTIVKDIP